MTGSGDFDPKQFIPYRLARATEALEQHFLGFSQGSFDLSWPEWQVFSVLGEQRTTTAKQVAAVSGLHKTKVSRAVAALEMKRWLTRRRDDDDRRLERLELTELGRGRYADLKRSAGDFEVALQRLLGTADMARLRDMLAELEESVIGWDPEPAAAPGGENR